MVTLNGIVNRATRLSILFLFSHAVNISGMATALKEKSTKALRNCPGKVTITRYKILESRKRTLRLKQPGKTQLIRKEFSHNVNFKTIKKILDNISMVSYLLHKGKSKSSM